MRLANTLTDGSSGAWTLRAGIALCALLAGCVTAPNTPSIYSAGYGTAPRAQLPNTAPPAAPNQPPAPVKDASPAPSAGANKPPAPVNAAAPAPWALADAAAVPTPPVRPEAQKGCIALASDKGLLAGSAPTHRVVEAPPQAETPAAEIPDPASGDTAKAYVAVLNRAQPSTTGPAGDLGKRIAARSAELSAAATEDAEAEKAAEAGRTARAAELYAAHWKASPNDWSAAERAVELWDRVGDYLSADILLKEVIEKAGSTQQQDLADQAQALDKKLNLAAGATAEADRLWRRTFALEGDGHYTEAVALLRRLQEFDTTAPGYYIREASFFARCNDAPHAADAIARGSAAGVSFAGRWTPARDPSLVRLWPNPEFQDAIRDTLGEAAAEDFDEHLTAQ